MNSSASPPQTQPSWKQEVNQRLAAHKNRKNLSAADKPVLVEPGQPAGSAAARAAARVAARFAQAPSYSQMLAEEARAAVRAAEAASHAALEAQAAAESVLAGLEAASSTPERAAAPAPVKFFDPFVESFLDPEPALQADQSDETAVVVAPVSYQPIDPELLEIRWEPDMPVRPPEPAAARAPRVSSRYEIPLEHWRAPAPMEGEPLTVEPAQPIHANLIEFPRELVATRKARPRMAEGPFAVPVESGAQLSIFEVDPGAISIQPAAAVAAPAASNWSNLKLDAEPAFDLGPDLALDVEAPGVHLAPLSWRVMAALVDGLLIACALFGTALIAAVNLQHPPTIKSAEITGAIALFIIGVLYQTFFFTFTEVTPGMRYAGISLCTLDDQRPEQAQLHRRVFALILSLLPVGLGVLWAIFDEQHLSWHDRLSGTYQRRG